LPPDTPPADYAMPLSYADIIFAAIRRRLLFSFSDFAYDHVFARLAAFRCLPCCAFFSLIADYAFAFRHLLISSALWLLRY